MNRSILGLAVAAPLFLLVATEPADAASHSPKTGKQTHHPAHRAARVQPPTTAAPSSRSEVTSFAPAPVPNPDISPPVEPENRRPHLAPTVFHLTNEYIGQGYPYGSSPQGMDDRHAAVIPGINLTAPIR